MCSEATVTHATCGRSLISNTLKHFAGVAGDNMYCSFVVPNGGCLCRSNVNILLNNSILPLPIFCYMSCTYVKFHV